MLYMYIHVLLWYYYTKINWRKESITKKNYENTYTYTGTRVATIEDTENNSQHPMVWYQKQGYTQRLKNTNG